MKFGAVKRESLRLDIVSCKSSALFRISSGRAQRTTCDHVNRNTFPCSKITFLQCIIKFFNREIFLNIEYQKKISRFFDIMLFRCIHRINEFDRNSRVSRLSLVHSLSLVFIWLIILIIILSSLSPKGIIVALLDL